MAGCTGIEPVSEDRQSPILADELTAYIKLVAEEGLEPSSPKGTGLWSQRDIHLLTHRHWKSSSISFFYFGRRTRIWTQTLCFGDKDATITPCIYSKKLVPPRGLEPPLFLIRSQVPSPIRRRGQKLAEHTSVDLVTLPWQGSVIAGSPMLLQNWVRGLELHQDLQVMSLMCYYYTTSQ